MKHIPFKRIVAFAEGNIEDESGIMEILEHLAVCSECSELLESHRSLSENFETAWKSAFPMVSGHEIIGRIEEWVKSNTRIALEKKDRIAGILEKVKTFATGTIQFIPSVFLTPGEPAFQMLGTHTAEMEKDEARNLRPFELFSMQEELLIGGLRFHLMKNTLVIDIETPEPGALVGKKMILIGYNGEVFFETNEIIPAGPNIIRTICTCSQEEIAILTGGGDELQLLLTMTE